MHTHTTSAIKEHIFSLFESYIHDDMPLQRLEAWQEVEKQDFPTSTHEEWKYFNLMPILQKEYKLPSPSTRKAHLPFEMENQNYNVVVFINGYFCAEQSHIIDQHLWAGNLQTFQTTHQDLYKQHFAHYAHAQDSIFTAMNTALAQDGAVVYIPKGKSIENPVILHFLNDATHQHLTQYRNLIIASAGSVASVLSLHTTEGVHSGFTNTVTEIWVDTDANLTHYQLQDDSPNAYQIHSIEAHQEDKSTFSNVVLALQGGMIRNNLSIRIKERCETNMYALTLLDGESIIDHHTLADHTKPHSQSNEVYKNILDGSSRAVFNGKIYVRPHAQKTNAYQSNRNILLSDKAIVDTKPQLEIWADDVKCSHGSATGAMDEEAMFYLRARGIPFQEAQALLLTAFAEDVLQNVKTPFLKKYIEHKIEQKLK